MEGLVPPTGMLINTAPLPSIPFDIYRVIQEEILIFSELIISLIMRKKTCT